MHPTLLRFLLTILLVSVFILGALAALFGVPSTHTVSYFKAHPTDLAQTYAVCRDNPGEAMTDPNCQNATEAKMHREIDALLTAMPK